MKSEHHKWTEGDSLQFTFMDDAITLDFPKSAGAWEIVPLTKPEVGSIMHCKQNITVYGAAMCNV